MCALKVNYGRKGLRNRCPMCQSEKDTTENVLECNKGDRRSLIWRIREGKKEQRFSKFIERRKKIDNRGEEKIHWKNKRKEKKVEELRKDRRRKDKRAKKGQKTTVEKIRKKDNTRKQFKGTKRQQKFKEDSKKRKTKTEKNIRREKWGKTEIRSTVSSNTDFRKISN